MRRGIVAALVLLGLPLAVAGGNAPAGPGDAPAVIIAGGDILLDRGVGGAIAAQGPSYPFDSLRAMLQGADLSWANLETALSDADVLPWKTFRFRADLSLAGDLARAGLDALCLANNHSYDCGREELLVTIERLRRAGVTPFGAGPDQRAASRACVLRVNGMRVALLGFVDMPLEDLLPLPDRPGPALADVDSIEARIREARTQADLVIVSLHWGGEYREFPWPTQRALARRIVAAGADVILGHHPHVLEGAERIGSGVVFYSVGNLVFDQEREECRRALLVRITAGRHDTPRLDVLPVSIDRCQPRPARGEEARRIVATFEALSDSLAASVQPDGWWRIAWPARTD